MLDRKWKEMMLKAKLSVYFTTRGPRLVFVCQSKALQTTASNINVNIKACIVSNMDFLARLDSGNMHFMQVETSGVLHS